MLLSSFSVQLSSSARSYQPSSVDDELFVKLKSAPNDQPHVARWWNHIGSFTKEERTKWPKGTVPMNGAPAAAGSADEDEEDIDLFGSDDDEAVSYSA